MYRNRVDNFSNVPTPSLPRVKDDLGGVHVRRQTFAHGRLIPWYCRFVYPHSTIKQIMSSFIRMDTSLKVPLDEVLLDNYWFFVPCRILDKYFENIIGYKQTYDSNDYSFPTFAITTSELYPMTHNSIINYLGYGADHTDNTYANHFLRGNSDTGAYYQVSGNDPDVINPYPLAAYYLIYNQYFRDENLDPEIPIEDLLVQGSTTDRVSLIISGSNRLWNNFDVLPVNRFHDIFSSGLISPIKDEDGNGDVYIPLNLSQVPVITGSDNHAVSGAYLKWLKADGSNLGSEGILYNSASGFTHQSTQVPTTSSVFPVPSNLYSDLSSVGTSVNQLYLSMALYSLYDKRGTFGSRLIEQIRGSFGLQVPDGLLDRVEYLGGNTQTLNNTPVLNTADDLGEMRGNSATLTNLASFEKSFNEWGFLIGVSCTRVRHTYNQGVVNSFFDVKDSLDLYWPEFANISKTAVKARRLNNSIGSDENVFNYNKPWIDIYTEIDFSAGDFGSFHDFRSNDLMYYWSYQDIYSSDPTFNYDWLKEPSTNLTRTLTGQLVPYATDSATYGNTGASGFGHQFMIEYKYRTELTMPKAVDPHFKNLAGLNRL